MVNVVNVSIEWYTKAGVRQNRQSLRNFFTSLAPLTNTFDPKVVYDQYENRFVVLTMERTEANATTGAVNSSRVFVAVSDDSDPNGTWYYHTLLTEETIGANQSWADFPGLAVDSEAIYFTTNMFAHNNQPNAGAFTGQRTWIIAKSPFYTGGAAAATRYNAAAEANANPAGDGAVVTTMQPAQMYGDTPGGVGTYLVAYSGLSNGTSNFVQVIRVDNPLSSPIFTGALSLVGTRAADDATNLALLPAPQLGTTRTIQTNDRRVSQNAVFRNDLLYFAAPIRPPVGTNANQTTAHYFVLNTTNLDDPATTPPVDQGNIGGEDIAAGTFTFFPSVAVDSAGNMAIGFAASAPSIYPGAYYTGRLSTDAAGTTQPATALRAGVDYYIRTFGSSPTAASRWGDYSGIWLDPSDETTFWVYNEYALTRGTTGIGSTPNAQMEDGRWGTAFGSFTLTADLALTKTVDRATAPVGAIIAYILTVTNNGTGTATDVTIVDTLPSIVDVGSVSTQQGTFSRSGAGGRIVTFNIGSVAPGASVRAFIRVRGNSPGTAVNTATVRASTFDPLPGDNTATATTQITSNATLSSLVIRPTPPQGSCDATTGTITLSGAATSNVTVNLSSNNANASTPPSVTIPTGSSSATFPVTTSAVSSSQSATITATVGASSVNQTFTIRPIGLGTLTLDSTTVAAGSNVMGTVMLRCPAVFATAVDVTSRLQGQPVSSGTTVATANFAVGDQSEAISFTAPATPGTYVIRAGAPGGSSFSVTLVVQ